jgi:branched-chain amino acid transport system substrate-binding protein
MVGLLVSLLAATACGSRLETGDLQAANGVLTKGSNAAGASDAGPGDEAAASVESAGPAGTVPGGADTSSSGSAAVGGGSAGGGSGGGSAVSAGGGPASGNRSSASGAAATATPGAGLRAAARRAAGNSASGGGGPASGAQSTAPVPGNPAGDPKPEILLGSFGAGSGILGAVTGTVPPAIRAWASHVNATGGLAGHPVRVIMADDAGDPARTQSIVRQMVEQSKVVAFIAHYSFTLTGVERYLESKGVPLIGGTGGDTAEDHSSVIFQPLMGADDGGAWGFLLAIAAQTEKKKMAVLYCREVAQCATKIADMKEKLPYNGLEIVYETQISLAQPDYTAEMIQAQRAGAEVVTAMVDAATMGRLAQSAHRQGYKPTFSGPWNLDIDPTIAAGKELDGVFIGPARTPMYQTSPKLADYREAMARYQPKDPLGGLGASVFVFGRLLEKVIAPLGTVTSEGIIRGLMGLRGETLDGFLPGVTFPPGNDRTKVNHCVIPYTLKGGKFVAWKPTEEFYCAPGWSPAR